MFVIIRDPLWMNRHIKDLILYKDNFYNKFVHGKNYMFHLLTFNNLQNHLNQFIQKTKIKCLSKVAIKPIDPLASTKWNTMYSSYIS